MIQDPKIGDRVLVRAYIVDRSRRRFKGFSSFRRGSIIHIDPVGVCEVKLDEDGRRTRAYWASPTIERLSLLDQIVEGLNG